MSEASDISGLNEPSRWKEAQDGLRVGGLVGPSRRAVSGGSSLGRVCGGGPPPRSRAWQDSKLQGFLHGEAGCSCCSVVKPLSRLPSASMARDREIESMGL